MNSETAPVEAEGVPVSEKGRGRYPSEKWITFLRKYGPIATNDNMYDEVIERAVRRTKIRPIELPALYLTSILENFRKDCPCSVILTGTAGDGKTYHCRRVWSDFGGTERQWNEGKAVQRLSIPAGELVIVKDLTELRSADSDELLRALAQDLVDGARRFYLVAANHGQLMEKWRTAATTDAARQVGGLVEDLLVTGDAPGSKSKLLLYNLSAQSGAEMLPLVLDQVLKHPEWDNCSRCPVKMTGSLCPILENRTRLHDGSGAGLMRKRLEALAELSEQNGIHFPIRHLLLLATNMLLGHPDAKDGLMGCDDVVDIVGKGRAHLASVYRNVFGENLPSRRREATDIFEKLARFGIGGETSNRIDGVLVYGADDPALRPAYERILLSDEVYGGTQAWVREQREYVEGGGADAEGRSASGFLEALRAQRQRIFFALPDASAAEFGLWDLTVYRHAGLYLELVRCMAAGEPAPRAALSLLIKGLNRVFTGMLVQNPTQLVLGTSGSHSQSKTSRLLAALISVPPRLGEAASIVSRQQGRRSGLSVQLVRDGSPAPVVLALTLLRFEFLCRVADGALPSSFSLECYEDLLAFKSKLLRALEERRALEPKEESANQLVMEFIDLNADGVALAHRVEVQLK